MQAHCYNNQAQHVIRRQANENRDLTQITFYLIRHPVVQLLSILLLLQSVITTKAMGSEYQLSPFVYSATSYNDNVSLAPANNEEVINGHELTTGADLSYDDQLTTVKLRATASFDRFDATRFDTDDQSATLTYQRRFERGSISANGNIAHTSANALEDQDTDIGSRETEATRADASSLSLSAQYNPSENVTFQGSLSSSLRSYESNNLQGYEYYSASGLWQYVLTERFRLQTQASYARYLPDKNTGLDYTQELLDLADDFNITGVDLDGRLEECLAALPTNFEFIFPNLDTPKTPENSAFCFDRPGPVFETEQNTATLQMGFVYLINEKLSLNVLAGRSETGTTRDSFSVAQRGQFIARSKDRTASYNGTLTYTGETFTSSFDASQREAASSNGTLSLNRRAEWRNTWDISALSKLNFNLVWFEQRFNTGSGSRQNNIQTVQNNEPQNTLASVEYRHKLTSDWQAIAQYSYRLRSYSTQLADSDRNRVSLTITWRPSAKIWSR